MQNCGVGLAPGTSPQHSPHFPLLTFGLMPLPHSGEPHTMDEQESCPTVAHDCHGACAAIPWLACDCIRSAWPHLPFTRMKPLRIN